MAVKFCMNKKQMQKSSVQYVSQKLCFLVRNIYNLGKNQSTKTVNHIRSVALNLFGHTDP